MEQKNYTLRFFNAINDCIEKNGNKYYMLLVENENGKTMISKMVKCNHALEMKQTMDLIRNDRMLLINYLMKNENKYIDTLVEDVNAIVDKFFNNKKNERLKTLLYNAIVLLEEQFNTLIVLEQLGMTSEEYHEIMGE